VQKEKQKAKSKKQKVPETINHPTIQEGIERGVVSSQQFCVGD